MKLSSILMVLLGLSACSSDRAPGQAGVYQCSSSPDQLTQAVMRYARAGDAEGLLSLVSIDGQRAGGESLFELSCLLMGGEGCEPYLNDTWRPLSEFMSQPGVDAETLCPSDSVCWLMFMDGEVERETALLPESYGVHVFSTKAIGRAGCWHLETPLFGLGADNPLLGDYG